jgi:hypothetical protein
MPDRLPRRDYVLLPLLSILTMLVLFGIAEGASRLVFPERKQDSCAVPDPRLGHHYQPNCVSLTKAAEGPWVTNRYNDRGSRATAPCGLKPPGSMRVVVTGSSVAQAYMVPYSESFMARAANALGSRCHRAVEFQDFASIGYIWNRLYDRLGDELAIAPDAVVMVTVPFDLEQTPPGSDGQRSAPVSLMKRIDNVIDDSRAMFAAEHFMFENMPGYISLYLRYGDKADFLRPPFRPAWQKRLADFDALLGRMAERLSARGVPFVLIFMPQRAQAALLQNHAAIPGVDPAAFGEAIGQIAARHGIQYVDLSPVVGKTPNPGALYYPVDGHLNGEGHELLAQGAEQGLAAALPALRSCANGPPTQQTADSGVTP